LRDEINREGLEAEKAVLDSTENSLMAKTKEEIE